MKKTILSLAVLAGAAGAAQAQTPASTVGITVGYGRTSLTGKNSNYNARTHSAYQAGLTADAYLSEVISFHPELLYTLQYYDATEGNSSSLDALSRDVSYLNVPLLVRYHADGLFFEAGPEVNFALAAKNEAGNNVKSDFNTTTLDYVVGLGYQLNHGPSIGIRYDGGATNTYKSTASNSTLAGGNFKNSTFWLNLGYSFGGGK